MAILQPFHGPKDRPKVHAPHESNVLMHYAYYIPTLQLTLVNHCLFFSLFGGEILPAGQNHLLKTFGIKYEIMATYITYIDLHPKHDIRFF